MTKLGLRKLHICPKVTKMGSIMSHRIDYNGVRALRGQRHIPIPEFVSWCSSYLADFLLKGVLTDVNVMDELARGLDPVRPPGTSYWVHLAEVLQVTDEVKMRCQCNPQCSPSKHMLDFKEAVDRDFLVQQLKDGLCAISRNDLVQKVEECDLPCKY